MRSFLRAIRAPLVVLTLGLTILTACGGVPALAGIAAAIGSGVLLVVAVIALMTTQPGCTLNQPCLSLIPRDTGVKLDAGQEAGEDGGQDGGSPDRVGPCLSQVPPDAGQDAGEMDMGAVEIAPPETEYAVDVDRSRVVERLRREGVLTDDVASALEDEELG